MNDRILGEIQSESSSICITETARITWDGGELRLVNNNEGITVDDEDYSPCGLHPHYHIGEGLYSICSHSP